MCDGRRVEFQKLPAWHGAKMGMTECNTDGDQIRWKYAINSKKAHSWIGKTTHSQGHAIHIRLKRNVIGDPQRHRKRSPSERALWSLVVVWATFQDRKEIRAMCVRVGIWACFLANTCGMKRITDGWHGGYGATESDSSCDLNLWIPLPGSTSHDIGKLVSCSFLSGKSSVPQVLTACVQRSVPQMNSILSHVQCASGSSSRDRWYQK